MLLGKVEYDTTKHKAFMAELLNQTIVFFLDGLQKRRAPSKEEWISEFLPCWANFVVTFSPFIKHPKFKASANGALSIIFRMRHSANALFAAQFDDDTACTPTAHDAEFQASTSVDRDRRWPVPP
jgi:hypothetical protein